MTTATPERRTRPWTWGEAAIQMANDIAAADFPFRDLARLRRMDPDAPNAAPFWRLMARYGPHASAELDRGWGLVIHGIALMTRVGAPDPAGRSAHDRNLPVGRALFEGGAPDGTTAFYSETRLNRLLTARGPMLRRLLVRVFRMLAAADRTFDWYQMAELILNDGRDEQRADYVRRRIARDYYRADDRARLRLSEQTDDTRRGGPN